MWDMCVGGKHLDVWEEELEVGLRHVPIEIQHDVLRVAVRLGGVVSVSIDQEDVPVGEGRQCR